MKNRKFLRIIALVCVLVLCLSVFVACDKDKTPGNNGGNNGGKNPGGNKKEDTMTEFVNTLFSSANEIGSGVELDLSAGKNIALSLGATITIKKDDGYSGRLPIDLALKCYIDRENIVNGYRKDAEGEYVLKGNAVEEFNEETKLADGEVRVNKDGDGYVVASDGAYVAKFIAFDATNAAQAGYERFSLVVQLTSANETYIDLSARINDVDSFRLIYENDYLYATIAGNKVAVDLNKLATTESGQSIKDTVFTTVEGLLRSDIATSIVNAFSGEKFDLNEIITGIINNFVKKTYIEYNPDLYRAASRNRYDKFVENGKEVYVKSENGAYVVKTLADTIYADQKAIFMEYTLGGLMEKLFGSKDKIYDCLGETIDLKGILLTEVDDSTLASQLFGQPTWKVWKNGKFVISSTGFAGIKTSQKIAATIALNPLGVGDNIAVTKNGAIKIGFEKEAGKDGSIGKLSKLFVDINLPSDKNTFGVELAITDLKVGNDKDAIDTTVVDKNEYGAMDFDAGLDFDFGENLLDLVAHDYTDANGFTFKVGGSDLTYDEATKTITVPSSLKLNIKGHLDFVNIENTRAFATITANDKTFAKIQFYAVNTGSTEMPVYDLQLDAKVMDEYKNVIPAILDACVYMGKNGGIGVNGFRKVGGKWGFYDSEDNAKIGEELYDYYEVAADGKYGKHEDGTYFLIEEGTSYTGDRYTRYVVNYRYAKLNESLNHLIMNGEAHVTGLNILNIVNYFINPGENKIFANFDKVATASGEITMNDVIMNLLLNDKYGIVPAVYEILNIDTESGLDNSLVIGGDKLLPTVFDKLFNYTFADKNTTIDAVSMVGLAMKYFTKYQVIAKGKTYDTVAVYKEFETELYKMTSRGIFANGLSKQLMILRPADYRTDGEKYFAENKDDATTATMKKYGYAVVKDESGNKYLYPYVMFEDLYANKGTEGYVEKEGFKVVGGELVLVNTPEKLLAAINEKFAKATELGIDADNYLDILGTELRQAYRLGKVYVPYCKDGVWQIADLSENGVGVNSEILGDIGVKVIVGTKKDGDRVTYGTVTVKAKLYGKDVAIKGYVHFLTEDATDGLTVDEKLVSDDAKAKAFEISIRNPKD